MKIGIIGDLHLGKAARGFGRTEDVYKAWNLFIEEARDEGCDVVVQTGDVFDGSSPDPDLVALSIRMFRAAASIFDTVIVYPGNHDLRHGTDRSDTLAPLRAAGIEGVYCPKGSACYELAEGIGAIVLPYESKSRRTWNTPDEYDKEILDGIRSRFGRTEPRLIALGHLDVEGASVSTESIARGGGHLWPNGKGWRHLVDVAVNGHYHLPHSVRFGAWEITNVGTPTRLDFGEAGDDKRWLCVEL